MKGVISTSAATSPSRIFFFFFLGVRTAVRTAEYKETGLRYGVDLDHVNMYGDLAPPSILPPSILPPSILPPSILPAVYSPAIYLGPSNLLRRLLVGPSNRRPLFGALYSPAVKRLRRQTGQRLFMAWMIPVVGFDC